MDFWPLSMESIFIVTQVRFVSRLQHQILSIASLMLLVTTQTIIETYICTITITRIVIVLISIPMFRWIFSWKFIEWPYYYSFILLMKMWVMFTFWLQSSQCSYLEKLSVPFKNRNKILMNLYIFQLMKNLARHTQCILWKCLNIRQHIVKCKINNLSVLFV